MRFFVTASIRSHRGPRLILSIALLFFIAFLAANAALLHLQTGLLPERVMELYEPSLTVRLERAHLQIFLFLMLNLFTASVLVRSRAPWRVSQISIIGGAFLTISYLLSSVLGMTVLFSVLALTVHAWFLAIILYLFVDLFRESP